MNDRIGLADLVWPTEWIDGDGDPTESHPHSDERLSFPDFLYLWRCGQLAVFGYRRGSTELEELPITWADLPAKWDAISATVSWNGISFAYLTVGPVIPSVTPVNKIKAPGVIGPAFKKWTDTLPKWPTLRQAIDYARENNYLQSAVLKLYRAGLKRERGRPPKTNND